MSDNVSPGADARAATGIVPADATVPTALGTVISPSDLGGTLVHERLFAGVEGYEHLEAGDVDMDVRANAVVASLETLRGLGVDSIVDVTAIGAGRSPALVGTVSRRSGVQIVCVTGVDPGLGVPTALRRLSPERLADVYLRDLTTGIGDSRVRAGAIVASPDPDDEAFTSRMVLATAFAHAETGVPVIVRGQDEAPHGLVSSLAARGVDPGRILATHLDDLRWPLTALDQLADMGVLLGFTQIGHDHRMNDQLRSSLAAYIIERCGPDRVCFATDSYGHVRAAEPGSRADGTSSGPDHLESFLKALQTRLGVERLPGEMLTAGARSLFTSQHEWAVH